MVEMLISTRVIDPHLEPKEVNIGQDVKKIRTVVDHEKSVVNDLGLPPRAKHKVNGNHLSFMEQMTFANNNQCDCDECDIDPSIPASAKPSVIEEAYMHHQKKDSQFISTSRNTHIVENQQRKLICREECEKTGIVISLYRFLIPINSTPLFEYGNSLRFVYVSRLNKNVSYSYKVHTLISCENSHSFYLMNFLAITNYSNEW